MNLFTLIFTPAMLLMPLVCALCVPLRPEAGGDAALARVRTIRLVIATVVALAFFAVLHVVIGRWAAFAWPLFFPLFFVFAIPVMAAKNPDTVTVHPRSPSGARTAALVSRVRKSPLRAWHWAIVWSIPVAATVLVALGLRYAEPANPAPPTQPTGIDAEIAAFDWSTWTSIGTLAIWIVSLALLPIGIRMVLREPEPMDATGSAELARAYERHRNFKIWGFYIGCGVLMNLLICGTAAASPWLGAGEAFGFSGSGFGILLGLGGAVFGTVASVQRVRITRLLRELSERKEATLASGH